MVRDHDDHDSIDAFREPVRLVEGRGSPSDALRKAADQYRAGLDEEAAYQRVASSLRGPARMPARGLYVALGVAAAAALLLVGRELHRGTRSIDPQPALLATVSPSPTPATPPTTTATDTAGSDEPPIEPSVEPKALRKGRTRLSDGSVVRLADGSDASVHARADAAGTTIELPRGSVELEVAKQPPEHRLEVVSGIYHFVALGTQFTVSVATERVELQVTEGTVGVYEHDDMIARVEPGRFWSVDTQPGSRPRPPNEPPPRAARHAIARSENIAPPGDAPDCAALARTSGTIGALDCYANQSKRDGMAGELALYEIARLRKDVLSDYVGALEALKSYDQRFPKGTLRGEVQVSRVEILGRLGRTSEALTESARLLETPWGKERAADLHLLRGHLYRQSLHDYARAATEYAFLSDESGQAGDEAQFQRAFCLDKLGDSTPALRAYDAYLKRSHPRHASEARARIETLSP